MVEAETRTGKWVDPVGLKQTANCEPEKESDDLSCLQRRWIEAERHVGRAKADNHIH